MNQDQVQTLMVEVWNARMSGRPADAESALRRVLEFAPLNVEAHVALAMLAAESGDNQRALIHVQDGLKIDPRNGSALTWASLLQVRLDQPERAQRYAEAAVKATNAHPDALEALAAAYAGQKRFAEAAGILERVLTARPDRVGVLKSLAAIYNKLLNERALVLYLRITEIDTSADAFRELAHEQIGRGLVDDAIESLNKAIAIDPHDARLHANLGAALFDSGRTAEAEEAWDMASRLDSPPGEVSFIRGLTHIRNGRFEDGLCWMGAAIAENPLQAKAYQEIFFGKRVSEEDRGLVEQAKDLSADPRLTEAARIDLAYGLGKAHDNLGDYEQAMAFYDEANRLKRLEQFGSVPFDSAGFESLISSLIRSFPQTSMDRLPAPGASSDLPIVVMGAMRSGTTLLDQILSSHPRVGSAGEQPFWASQSLRMLVDPNTGRFDRAKFAETGAAYCDLLMGVAPGFDRVVEKNPNNITAAGLINLALPDARLIHVRRHPVDNALSMWFTAFNTSAPYVYDREAIVFAYRQLMRLADHWLKVLPADRYLEISYEGLILDRKTTIRRVVEFCGLEWNESCLHPERNERTVRTPSYWQVRQPLNPGSIEKWKRYEPWLGAFKKLL